MCYKSRTVVEYECESNIYVLRKNKCKIEDDEIIQYWNKYMESMNDKV